MTVLGSGGAARAVAVALGEPQGPGDGLLRATSKARGRSRALVGGAVGEFPPRPASWDVLVNATPVGSEKMPGTPMGECTARRHDRVRPGVRATQTRSCCSGARAAGCQTIGGLEMLIAQAERQFELWTGQRPPAGLFEAAATASEKRPRSPTAGKASRNRRQDSQST